MTLQLLFVGVFVRCIVATMQAMSFSAWNGLGLALVIPCVQSLIADTYSSASRGRAFGLLFFTSSLGGCSQAWHGRCQDSAELTARSP